VPTSSWRVKRARLAALERHRSADDSELVAARAAFATDETDAERRAESLERHVRAIVDRAVPLNQAQRDKIAALLRPTPNGGDAA
jgi:hypothetical protein